MARQKRRQVDAEEVAVLVQRYARLLHLYGKATARLEQLDHFTDPSGAKRSIVYRHRNRLLEAAFHARFELAGALGVPHDAISEEPRLKARCEFQRARRLREGRPFAFEVADGA